jgi:hypothetical protein
MSCYSKINKETHSHKISFEQVEKLNMIVEATVEKPITIKVDVDLVLSPRVKDVHAETIAKGIVK